MGVVSGSVQITVYWLICSYFRPADRRPSKVISKAFSAAFQRLDQRWRAVPLGWLLHRSRPYG
jgi:hypothetical protein